MRSPLGTLVGVGLGSQEIIARSAVHRLPNLCIDSLHSISRMNSTTYKNGRFAVHRVVAQHFSFDLGGLCDVVQRQGGSLCILHVFVTTTDTL